MGLVTEDQAGGMGGADKPAGAQADNTFQSNKIKQIVFLVRFNLGGFDTGAAAGMVGGVTGAIEGAVGAVEDVMASIPGLDMFIKEDKAKKSTSDKEYTYYKNWGDWDKAFTRLDKALQELNPENKTEKFEFSATDAAGRKSEGQKLLSKLQNKMSSWSGYTAKIHFIGLSQGGNVVNECTQLLADDGQFKSEKWNVQSVIYVGTPVSTNQHVLNQDVLKGEGAVFSFGSAFDLTQRGVGFFEDSDALIKLIQDSNQNTMSLMIGKVKLRIISALAIVLSGLHLTGGDSSELNKFAKIKDEVVGLVEDVIDLIKKLIKEGGSIVNLDGLPEFSKLVDGYGAIPGQAGDRISTAISKLTDSLKNQAKSADVSLSPQSLAGLLTCLCPLFDAITRSLSVFKYGSETAQQLAQQVIDNAGTKKVYAPSSDDIITIDVDPAYTQKTLAAYAADKPQMAGALVSTVSSKLSKAAENTTEVSKMSNDQKTALAEAIAAMVQPMLPTKKAFYNKLLHAIPFDPGAMMKEYTANKLMAIPGGALSNINVTYPQELQASITAADAEITRVKGYFEKTDYTLPEDTLYFIFNQHNLALKKMWGPIAACIDNQTGYTDFKRSTGFDAVVTTDAVTYQKVGEAAKENVMPAKELPSAQPA